MMKMCDWIGCNAEDVISFSYLKGGGNLCDEHVNKFYELDKGMHRPMSEDEKKLYIRRLKSFLRQLKGYARYSDVSKFVDPDNLNKNAGVINPETEVELE